MRLLHTSDWHLGRTFGGFSLHADQVQFVDWFVGQVKATNAEVVIVAGDIFDRAVPPAESVVLWRSALTRIQIGRAHV